MNISKTKRLAGHAKPVRKWVMPPLKVVLVYEDSLARSWVLEGVEELNHLARSQVEQAEWPIHRLLEDQAFPSAVEAAAQADIMVVALHGATGLPIPLCVWIDAWLPRRGQRTGALVAWLGQSAAPTKPGHVHQYLQAVARKADLNFMVHEPVRPAAARECDELVF